TIQAKKRRVFFILSPYIASRQQKNCKQRRLCRPLQFSAVGGCALDQLAHPWQSGALSCFHDVYFISCGPKCNVCNLKICKEPPCVCCLLPLITWHWAGSYAGFCDLLAP